jgi:hypothetical protein
MLEGVIESCIPQSPRIAVIPFIILIVMIALFKETSKRKMKCCATSLRYMYKKQVQTSLAMV